MTDPSEPTDFLYPMVDGGHADSSDLLEDLARSASAKARTSHEVAPRALLDLSDELDATAAAVAERVRHGGRLLTCGNGGSATDAEGLAVLFTTPPDGPVIAARSLAEDVSVLTALANDLGYDAVFSRQVQAHGREHDVLVALSTSGNSTNVLAAARAARKLGMLTIGFSGDTGGTMLSSGLFDHVLVVRTTSIHRIQEAQSVLGLALWQRIHRHLVDDLAEVSR